MTINHLLLYFYSIVTSLPWLSRRGWGQRQREKTACGTPYQGTPEEGRRGEEGGEGGGEEGKRVRGRRGGEGKREEGKRGEGEERGRG